MKWLVLLALCFLSCENSKKLDYDEALELWESKDIRDYTIFVQNYYDSYNPTTGGLGDTTTFKVTVLNDTVLYSVNLETNDTSYHPFYPPTVNLFFEWIASAQADTHAIWQTFEIRYHKQYGYPLRIHWDASNIADEELNVKIYGLERLEAEP